MNITASSAWTNCQTFIEDNIPPQAFKTWFKPIVPVKLSDNILTIQVPSKFFYEWLEEHYVKLLKTALQRELGKEDLGLHFYAKLRDNEQTYLFFPETLHLTW